MATRSEGSRSPVDSGSESEVDRPHKRLKLDGGAAPPNDAEYSLSEVEDSEAEDSEAEDSEAEDSEAEDSDAEDSDAEDSDVEDSDGGDSDAEDSDVEGSGGGDSDTEGPDDSAKTATQSKRSRSPVDSVIEPEADRPHKRLKLDRDGAPQETTERESQASKSEEIERRLKGKGGVEGSDWIRIEVGEKWFRMSLRLYKPKRMNEATRAVIEKSRRTPPRFLYRVSSSAGIKKTNGYDNRRLHIPAAHLNDDEKCHDTIYDIPNGLGELKEMLGRRFLWEDRRRDETLSWTSSLLFAIVHATGRLAKGQLYVIIHVIDTTKVTTLEGKPVEFYFAPDLIDGLNIQSWPHWNGWEHNLTQPWYTHEWITHHVVKSQRTYSFEANIEDLLERGLYSILPGLKTSEEDELRSLYHRCVYTRGFYHHKDDEDRPPQPIIFQDIAESKRLARCFVDRRVRRKNPYCTPPLHIVVDFLSIVARLPKQKYFMAWIKANYTQQDLQYIEYERMTRIANNLPEQAQALELARDAHLAMDLPPISQTEIWMADENFSLEFKWLKDLPRKIVIRDRKTRKALRLEKMLDGDGKEKGRGKRRAGSKVHEAKINGDGTRKSVTQGGEQFASGSGMESSNDQDEVQIQIAVAASLEPGLLEEAEDKVDSQVDESEDGTSRDSSVLDADLRETLERSQYKF